MCARQLEDWMKDKWVFTQDFSSTVWAAMQWLLLLLLLLKQLSDSTIWLHSTFTLMPVSNVPGTSTSGHYKYTNTKSNAGRGKRGLCIFRSVFNNLVLVSALFSSSSSFLVLFYTSPSGSPHFAPNQTIQNRQLAMIRFCFLFFNLCTESEGRKITRYWFSYFGFGKYWENKALFPFFIYCFILCISRVGGC